jgi:hypothetical protein
VRATGGNFRSSAFFLYGKFGKQLLIRRKKMKKLRRRLSMIVVLAFLFTMVMGLPTFAAPWTSVDKVDAYSGVTIFYNGEELTSDKQPLIINDTTYVPLRLIMETIGNYIYWDAANYRVIMTGSSSSATPSEIADKDAQIAALEDKITRLENLLAAKGDLSDIADDLQDYFEDAGMDYFGDEIEATFSLDGDTQDIKYIIELDFRSADYYKDLSKLDQDDIKIFLDDVEEELNDLIDRTDFEDADITGELLNYRKSNLYVKFDGKKYTYSWDSADLDDIEDEIIDEFEDTGDYYFDDDDLDISISLDGDEDDLEFMVYIDFYYSDKYDDLGDVNKGDIEDFLDDLIDEIKDQIDGTIYEDADITGDLEDEDDSGYYVRYNGRSYRFSW